MDNLDDLIGDLDEDTPIERREDEFFEYECFRGDTLEHFDCLEDVFKYLQKDN